MTAAITTVSSSNNNNSNKNNNSDDDEDDDNALQADFVVPQLQQRGRRVGQVVARVLAVSARKVFALVNRPQGVQHVKQLGFLVHGPQQHSDAVAIGYAAAAATATATPALRRGRGDQSVRPSGKGLRFTRPAAVTR